MWLVTQTRLRTTPGGFRSACEPCSGGGDRPDRRRSPTRAATARIESGRSATFPHVRAAVCGFDGGRRRPGPRREQHSEIVPFTGRQSTVARLFLGETVLIALSMVALLAVRRHDGRLRHPLRQRHRLAQRARTERSGSSATRSKRCSSSRAWSSSATRHRRASSTTGPIEGSDRISVRFGRTNSSSRSTARPPAAGSTAPRSPRRWPSSASPFGRRRAVDQPRHDHQPRRRRGRGGHPQEAHARPGRQEAGHPRRSPR